MRNDSIQHDGSDDSEQKRDEQPKPTGDPMPEGGDKPTQEPTTNGTK